MAIGRLDGTLEQVNDAFLAIVGYTRADFRAGKVQWRGMTPPEWMLVDEQALARLRATGTTGTFEKEYVRKDGSRVAVLIGSAFLDGDELRKNDDSDRIVYFSLDISAQKRAEAELARLNAELENQVAERTAALKRANRKLRESLALVDALFQRAPIGLSFLDRDLRFVRINDELARINGVPVGGHLGRPLGEVLPAVEPKVIDHYRAVLATGRPVIDVEVTGERPAGRGDWLASYYPVCLEGEILGVGAVVLDITERKRADRELYDHKVQLERALGEARAALRARDVFVAVASHELKTPLTPLRLSLQALRVDLARVRSAERWLPRLDLLLRQVDRLTSLVDAILDVARSSSAPMATQFVATDLTELTREVLARFEPAAAQARCPLTLHTAGAAIAEVEPPRIEQVVSNLLANAIRFGAGKPITVSVLQSPASVRIVVEDSGIGIAPEDQARIFKLFERAADERLYGGLGLGLYIARSIVEAHGGTITLVSAPGSGARFEVELPRKQMR